jgi:hypothetical protein
MFTTTKRATRSEPPDIFAYKVITLPAHIGSQLMNATIALLVFGYFACRLH